MEHLRNLIVSDWRWLAHDPIANALTTRYKNALSDSWFKLEHESSDALRARLNLDPHREHKPVPSLQQGAEAQKGQV